MLALWSLASLITACVGDPERACPPGMVMVSGSGEIGMAGQPYAVVETAHLDVVDNPQARCPAARAARPDAAACWVQTDEVDPILRPRAVTVAPFCIDAWPFPGPGAAYTPDGMSTWKAHRLRELLATGGYGPRRLCTMTEFQAAVAGLEENRRFIYGDRTDPARCTSDPGSWRIGVDPECRNPVTGVGEYGAVHSHWVEADPAFVSHACDAPPCRGVGRRLLEAGMLVVAGGTGRVQTRQAPLTPHTWHEHGNPESSGCEAMGHDDQPIICSEPSIGYARAALPPELAAGEAAWGELVATARGGATMTAVLSRGLGRPACAPASDRQSADRMNGR